MKWLTKSLKFGFILILIGGLSAVVITAAAYLFLKPDLPSTAEIKSIRFQVPLRVMSADNKLIAEFGEKRRIPIGYQDTPEQMVHAFIAAEDDRFFTHPGVDYKGLLRAGIQLATTGKRRQGGSTITMQVARNLYLSRQKTFTRKFSEIFLALEIEQALSKPEILELYLNKIYLGHRSYGVGAAAQVYYGKSPAELTLAETAMIAGLPKAPSKYNPVTNPERAMERRNYVLGRMLTLGYITESDFQTALNAPVTAKIHAAQIELEAPYIAEMVRQYMTEKYGEDAYTEGYVAYTTVNSNLQEAATTALRNAIEDYDRRHGWRGPVKNLKALPDTTAELDKLLSEYGSVASLIPAVVTQVDEQSATVYSGTEQLNLDWDGLKWAKKYISENRYGAPPRKASEILATGDLIYIQPYTDKDETTKWRLAQIPAVSGALISLRPDDGGILALQGGYDYYSSKFNRAIQAERQPGSGFKAFVYSAALEAGFTAASIINDAPVVFDDPSLEDAWRPKNYSGEFFGPTRLRHALTKSRNLVSIRLLRSMGIKHAVEHIQRFGFSKEQLPHNLSLALGSASVTPLQMSRGYAVLANGGYLVDPYLVERIELDNDIIYQAEPLTVCRDCPEPSNTPAVTPHADAATAVADEAQAQQEPPATHAPRVISPENRYIMYSMMQDVIKRGTAQRARSLGRKDLAGKTGTTNEQRDAWFNGYNQSIVANVWIGFDNNDRLGRGEVGGRAALPAWIDFMKVALEGVPDEPPKMPLEMVTVRIDPNTGLRAPAGMENAIFEVFRADHVPDAAIVHSGPAGTTPAASTSPAPEENLF